jgi:molybdopterin-synthase adenylyltransferase
MLKPLLPSFLKINNIELVSHNPMQFDVCFGLSNFDGNSYQLNDYELYLVSLADGQKDCTEIIKDTVKEFEVNEESVLKTLNYLEKEQVLVDASVRPECIPDKSNRYSRHMLFFESLGLNGKGVQQKLNKSKVAIIGSGGIGTWLSYNLSAAGISELTLIDADIVEESNLTRQVLYTMEDIGNYKVESCAKRIKERSPSTIINTVTKNITSIEDMKEYINNVDLIVLAGDSPANINHLVNEYSFKNNVPWTRAGYHYYTAVCGPMYIPGQTACFECATEVTPMSLKNDLPFVSEVNKRYQVPSFAPVNGIAATIQAKEVISYLGEISEWHQTKEKMFVCDLKLLNMDLIDISTKKRCELCSN